MDKTFLIGIAGGSGSGKTTFAKKVLKNVDSDDVSMVHMDSYYLPEQPKTNITSKGKPNFDHPDAFDWHLLKHHLTELKHGKRVDSPTYDFTISRRDQKTLPLGPSKIIIVEGIFALFDPEIRDLMDIKCFLHVEADIRFTRRLHRDVKERGRSLESVIEQYYDTVRPMYQKHLAPQREYADFIVGEETDVASEILAAKVKELINWTLPPKVKNDSSVLNL